MPPYILTYYQSKSSIMLSFTSKYVHYYTFSKKRYAFMTDEMHICAFLRFAYKNGMINIIVDHPIYNFLLTSPAYQQ